MHKLLQKISSNGSVSKISFADIHMYSMEKFDSICFGLIVCCVKALQSLLTSRMQPIEFGSCVYIRWSGIPTRGSKIVSQKTVADLRGTPRAVCYFGILLG